MFYELNSTAYSVAIMIKEKKVIHSSVVVKYICVLYVCM